jgi:hypothetical protein
MFCTECQSNNRRHLKTEMMIHHANFRSGKADVLIFPVTWVCLDCGSSTFIVPLIELLALREGEIEAGARASSTDGLG